MNGIVLAVAAIVSAGIVLKMVWPNNEYQPSSDLAAGFGFMFDIIYRALWLIPLLSVWIVALVICYWIK